jgi:phage terminase large subunit-like protein
MCYDALAEEPGALADVFFDFWAREDQLVTVEEMVSYSLIIFEGPRRQGKTQAATQLFMREIHEGRSERPVIMAATEHDVDKTVVHGSSGIMEAMPPELRPRWIPAEGAAGVLRCTNGVEVQCHSARNPKSLVGYTCDLLLFDDVAKWQTTTAAEAWQQSTAACSAGNANRIAATTLDGTALLVEKFLSGSMDGVLVKRSEDLRHNRYNIAEKYYRQLLAEFGGTDWYRRAMLMENVRAGNPFYGLDFDAKPIRVLEAPRAEFVEVVVSVDPSDGKGGDHDDWGIGVAGRRRDRHVVVLDDQTAQYDDDEAREAAGGGDQGGALQASVGRGRRRGPAAS